MMSTSSKAGKRLAKARAEHKSAQEALAANATSLDAEARLEISERHLRWASIELGDELIAAGFADAEGDDA